jgi:hypothetical protein
VAQNTLHFGIAVSKLQQLVRDDRKAFRLDLGVVPGLTDLGRESGFFRTCSPSSETFQT